MDSFSAIGISGDEWPELIAQCKQYDFHHTKSYHLLEKEGEPLLFVARSGKNFVALPLILRNIGETGLNDFTSSYGFGGPVSNLDFEDVPPELFAYFRSELSKYFKEKNVVTAFCRLHPIIIGDELFSNFGTIRNIKNMVAIDLELPLMQQIQQYRKSNRAEVNQLRRKKEFIIKEATSEDEIRAFTRIYQENMKRVNASNIYFFDYDYFYNFLNSKCFRSKLLLAYNNGEIAAGAIFTITKKIMQYHLAATAEKYISKAPMKLILDEARLIGSELKLEYLHLGGSVGDSSNDTLYHFKSGFSQLRFSFRVWQYVVNEEKYEYLNQLFKPDSISSNFFPLYRS